MAQTKITTLSLDDNSVTAEKLASPINGNVTINGSISADSYVGGNVTNWNSTYSTVQANSASWTPPAAAATETTIYVDAAAMVPDGTNPPEASVNTDGNSAIDSYLFAGATASESVYFKWSPPPQWDLGTISIETFWSPACAAGPAPGDYVRWDAAAGACSSTDDWDTTFGTSVSAETAITSISSMQVTTISNITVGNSPANGDIIFFKLTRDITPDSSPSMGEDAQLWGARILYNNTSIRAWYTFKLGDETTDPTTASLSALTWTASGPGKIWDVTAACKTSPEGAPLMIDINKFGASILGPVLNIALSSFADDGTAALSATPTTFVKHDRFFFDIDQGTTSGGAGAHADLLIEWT